MKMPGSRPLYGVAPSLLGLAFGGRPSSQPAKPVGITFPTSGSAEARPVFLRGVTALHLFEYEEANEAFREAQKIDPGFVMAYWGEAMTYHQTLWRHEDPVAARPTLAPSTPTAAPTPTPPTPQQQV